MRLKPWRQFQRLLYSGIRNETGERIKTSAMVFAPHQDDETLGCGGTIMLKRRAGTPVSCVFMTDGSTSHRQYMQEDQLRSLRKSEAVNAAEVLGLEPEKVHYLNFPDGELKRFHGDAVAKVAALLDYYYPDEVYVPYRADGLPDHESTYAVVREAVENASRPVKICEYPIWFWNQWPWVPLQIRWNRDAVHVLLRMLLAVFGLRLLKECRSGVFVGDMLERKRQALAQYGSQMKVLRPGTRWPTLSDVSGGEFLKCFFQEYEVFRCRDIRGRTCSEKKIIYC